MSTAEASLILYLSYGITAGIVLAFILRQRQEATGDVCYKGLDVSVFRPNDVLFAFLLILFYLFFISITANGSMNAPQAQAPPAAAPAPLFLFVANIPFFAVGLAVAFRLRQPYLKSIIGWTGHASLNNLLLFPILGLGVCYGFYFLLVESGFDQWFRDLFHIKNEQTIVSYLKDGPLSVKISVAALALVFAPVIEEHVFRGYMYPILKKYTGMIPAALFTSLLFGCVHNSGMALLALSFMSLILIFLYEKTKTIWAPVIMHFAFNASTVAYTFYNY